MNLIVLTPVAQWLLYDQILFLMENMTHLVCGILLEDINNHNTFFLSFIFLIPINSPINLNKHEQIEVFISTCINNNINALHDYQNNVSFYTTLQLVMPIKKDFRKEKKIHKITFNHTNKRRQPENCVLLFSMKYDVADQKLFILICGYNLPRHTCAVLTHWCLQLGQKLSDNFGEIFQAKAY